METEDAEVKQAVEQFGEMIRGETLAVELLSGSLEGVEPVEREVNEVATRIYVARVEESTS